MADRDRDNLVRRVLGDVSSDPFDLGTELPSESRFSLPAWMGQPIPWGWGVLVVAVLVLLIVVLA
jgi:hypothetical protein